jgi:hypothetical protein
MATASLRKRFTKCVQCGTSLIFPGGSEEGDRRQTNDLRNCPVCGPWLSTIADVANGPDNEAKRLEEFFARFS